MGLLGRLQAATFDGYRLASSRDPLSDFWYQPLGGYHTTAGISVSPALAQTLSAVWQGSRLIGEGIGALPIKLYRRLGEGKKTEATDVPLGQTLAQSPNNFQTGIDFWDNVVQCALLRGLFIAQKVPGVRGAIGQLLPIHPDLVRPKRLPNATVVYHVRIGSNEVTLLSDEVFVVRGRTEPDGVTPMSTIRYGAQNLATSLSAQAFLGRFFQSGAAPGVAVSVDGNLGEQGIKNLHQSVMAYIGGLKNAFGVLPLEDGAKIEKIGVSPQDAQLVEILNASIADVARWLNIPLHMLRDDQSRGGTAASLEVFSAEFVAYTLRPWCVRIEQSVTRDLLFADQQQDLYAEFDLDALSRGNKTDRYNAYRTGIMSGFLTRNEARLAEGLDEAAGLDAFWEPLNISTVDGTAGGSGDPTSKNAPAPGQTAVALAAQQVPTRLVARAVTLAREAAHGILRKEAAVVERLAREHARDGDAWKDGLEAFYRDHAGYVASRLVVSSERARPYCEARATTLQRSGLAALEALEAQAVETLSVMALEGDRLAA